jgi:hypothetical protein
MVNLEKMLRQLMESQLQRAEGRPLPVEEEVVDLEPPEVMQPESLVDLTDHRIPESGQLTERRLKSSIDPESNIDHQVGRLKHEDAATQQAHAGHELGRLAHEDAAEQLHLSAGPKAVNLAAEIAEMLKTPQGMAQAILLAEIINRPTDRW